MSRSRNIVIALVALGLVIAGGLAWVNLNARPALITGDVWDYRLRPADLGADWSLSNQTVLDIGQLNNTTVTTETVDVPGLKSLYTASYTGAPGQTKVAELGVRVLLFETTETASTALAAETFEDGWSRDETVGAVTSADESHVWRFTDPDPDIAQGLWRVDFRVLNAIGSVSILGTAEGVPDASGAMAYAETIATSMRNDATPRVLKSTNFFQASPPDVRPYLLSAAQLAEVDQQFGDRWVINTLQLPSFTTNAEFSTEARPTLEKLGRLLGYQSYWVKGITQDEEAQAVGVLLFQQVSVYATVEGATSGLASMVGISKGSEIQPAPDVGDAARKWVIVTAPGQNPNGQSAVVEINFRVGRYVASVQLTSRPGADQAAAMALSGPADILAENLARQLADNLAKAP